MILSNIFDTVEYHESLVLHECFRHQCNMTNPTSDFHGINDIIYLLHSYGAFKYSVSTSFNGLFQDVLKYLYVIEFATVMNQT